MQDAVDEVGRGGIQGDELNREAESGLEPRFQSMSFVSELRLRRRVEEDAEIDVAPGPLLTPGPAAEQPG